MLLLELYNQDKIPEEYQTIDDDNSRPQYGDLRKSKLTLRQLNKLRRLNDIKQVEFDENLKKVQAMYGATEAPVG